MIKAEYSGIILTPEGWWLCQTKAAYDAWDWPDSPQRDLVLKISKAAGKIHFLGPRSMSSEQAMAAAMRVYGHEPAAGEALKGFQSYTDAGQEFLHGDGQFTRDEEEGT